VSAKPTATAAQVTLVSGVTYLPFGPLNTLTFGNGRILTKAYDANYGIDKVSDAATGGLSEDFTLNVVGNITGLVERTTGTANTTRAFTYDGQDRLTALKNGATVVQGFTYDATGNRLSKTLSGTTTTNTYPATNHRLTQTGTTVLTYDANGNQTKNGTPAFVYDDRNRLRDYKANGTALTRTYRYNGKGERVSKTIAAGNASNRYYTYDESGHLLGEYLASGARVQEYVWLDDTLVAVLSDHDGTTYQYVETDHLGTPRAIINPANNTIVWRWNLTNTAFGEHAPVADPDANAISYTFNLRYPGQWYDAESKLHYNYFRDYDPLNGRYVESDPIGVGGGVTTYAYVNSNPLIFTDALGLTKDQTCVAAYTTAGAVCGSAAGYYGGGVLGGVGGAAVCSPTGPGAAACAVGGAAGGSTLGGATGSVVGGVVGNLAGQAMCPDDKEEREKRCKANLDRDMATCTVLGNRFGKKAFAVCQQQAMLRYGNCLSGRDKGIDAPLPPWGKL
jgi:RHS repeat-associated protein